MILFPAGNKESPNRERDRGWNDQLTHAQQPLNENWLSVSEIPKPSAETICYHEILDTGRFAKFRTDPFLTLPLPAGVITW
jgi:hypothetical protein